MKKTLLIGAISLGFASYLMAYSCPDNLKLHKAIAKLGKQPLSNLNFQIDKIKIVSLDTSSANKFLTAKFLSVDLFNNQLGNPYGIVCLYLADKNLVALYGKKNNFIPAHHNPRWLKRNDGTFTCIGSKSVYCNFILKIHHNSKNSH